MSHVVSPIRSQHPPLSELHLVPVRGLIPSHNRKGRPFARIDLERWIVLSCAVLKTEKIDILARGEPGDYMPDLLECAERRQTRLSLRTDASAAPPDLNAYKGAGLLDVFLCPESIHAPRLDAWFEAARNAALPVRFQIQAPFDADLDPQGLAQHLAAHGVVAANVALFDPFRPLPTGRDNASSKAIVTLMNRLAATLNEQGIETHLLRLPFCHVESANRAFCLNSKQFFGDHQHYRARAYRLAVALEQRAPWEVARAVQGLLGRHTFARNPVDNRLLPWLLSHSYLYLLAMLWRKLTRHVRFSRRAPEALTNPVRGYVEEADELTEKAAGAMGPICTRCRLRRICDHATPEFRRVLPGLDLVAQGGELVLSPWHFAGEMSRHYDEVDALRKELPEAVSALAEEANRVISGTEPRRVLTSQDYALHGLPFDRMEGGIKWYSMTSVERVSTPLGNLEPPFTVSVGVGNGIADYIGFSFGRHCKLLCPMDAYRHVLALHVAADGHYVLLRDGHVMQPVEFEGAVYVPSRLGGRLTPRISIWNIEENITTQRVSIWHGSPRAVAALAGIRYSVMVVCTRFTRRLQAVLRSLAHQRDFDPRKLEVLVCYVPGLDATDDLLDSAAASYPEIRFVRAPFAPRYANAKGFMINETVRMASGEWVMLLDADTLVPPDMFARIEAVADTAHFIAPDGRKLLTPETTAKILLGEIEPWRQWRELLEGPGEFRLREAYALPVGFCQVVRKKCLEEMPYAEHDHFELADMHFASDVINKYGLETRLSGVPVVHLDHGGSQWFGTPKHL